MATPKSAPSANSSSAPSSKPEPKPKQTTPRFQAECGDAAVVQMVLDFQKTGRGFEPMWDGIGPTVDGMLRLYLRKRLVKGHRGGDDEESVAETTQQVRIQLWQLPGKGQTSWFDPSRKRSPAEALRAWLSGFCRHAVANYCTKWRGAGRRRKVLAESALTFRGPMNELAEFSSILKSAVAKIDPRMGLDEREFREIVNECVASLDDDLQSLVRLNHWDGLSERRIARLIAMNVSSVHRRLERARSQVGEELGKRGIDGG